MKKPKVLQKICVESIRLYLKKKYKPFKWSLFKLGIGNPVKRRRLRLSALINKMFNATVAYGPFKGLKLSSNPWWGEADRPSMLFGLYEQEVLNSLLNVPKTHKTFIDLGAADGYYGIGVLVNKHFDRSYCFELSKKGQEVIRRNADLNAVSNKITIYGRAERDFFKLLPVDHLSTSVLLVDIEGGEFDLLDTDLFKVLKDTIIFIELHPWLVEDGDKKLEKLKFEASLYFDITEITTTSRDLSIFPELRSFKDEDRWLICSEDRGRLMTWYRLDPKSKN
jgi:hypothetical protein